MEGAAEAVATEKRLSVSAVAIPLVVVALDQLTKLWVQAELAMNQPVSVVGENVRLLHIENKGAAFGLSVGPHSSTVFLVLASLAAILVLYLLLSLPAAERAQRVALALILGGAIGNIIDRVRLDGVVDFIQVGVAGHYWPIFNVADSAVTIGAIVLAYIYLTRRPAS